MIRMTMFIESVGWSRSWTSSVILHFESFSLPECFFMVQNSVFAWRPTSVIQIVKITLGQRFEAITTQEIVILDNSK